MAINFVTNFVSKNAVILGVFPVFCKQKLGQKSRHSSKKAFLEVSIHTEGGVTMSNCQRCQALLSTNEIAISLRLLGRDGRTLLCRQCLAQKFQVDEEIIDQKIQHYRAQGCPLFI